jgi:hypothetical protein
VRTVPWLIATVVAASAPATADDIVLLASRWPSVPAGHALSLEDQITERLTLMGNALGHHLDLLSHDMFQLTVDGHHRQAHVRLGGGTAASLAFRLDGDIQFADANARIHARLDIGFHGHELHLELPMFEMSPAAYRGDHGVELRLPLLERKF